MTVERVLIVPDTHAPFHDKKAWALMLRAAGSFSPHTVVHMGDLADFFSVSSHSKNPDRKASLKDEADEVKVLRQDLDDLGAQRKIFIEGNHEFRLERYLTDKAPELFGLTSSDDVLELSANGWQFVPYRRHTKVGKLYLTHDTNQGGKFATARALDTFQHSVAIGHHHNMSYLVGGNATGEHQVGAQFGWLGDREQIDYMHEIKIRKSWSLGFGVGYHDKSNGYVYLQPVPILPNYTCLIEGQIIRAR